MSINTLFINGCSHSAGSEIEASGIGESKYNRENCFGAQLAKKWNMKPINLSQPGGSNDYIADSTLLWCLHNPEKIANTFFLIHWTGAERTDFYTEDNGAEKFMDWCFDKNFGHVHPNHYCSTLSKYDKAYAKKLCKFLFVNDVHWEINKLMNIIRTQNMLKLYNAKFRFYNSFSPCSKNSRFKKYHGLIDKNNTTDLFDENETFYYWALNKGHSIEGQVHWHHRLPAHTEYAEKLYNEITL